MNSAPLAEPSANGALTGFIGTGMMGLRMARNLQRAGIRLVVHNRTRERAQALVSNGAQWADSPGDVGRSVGAGLIFLMLRDGPALRAVLSGPDGLVRGTSRGGLVVDHSTVDPADSRWAAMRLARRGAHFLDAPVGGSIGPAERGELTFFVGGATADVDRARPFLDRMGRRIEELGPVGMGSSMKLVNNLMTIGTVGLISEALGLSEGLGLPRDRVIEILRKGGGASAMLEGKREKLRTREYSPEFLLPLARKDLFLVERVGRRQGLPTPLARDARRLCDRALAEGHGADDFSSMAEAVRRRPRTETGV
ncbi:MAG TPA: NAD(P)-dependent oxidoreductase [Thermoplasmata archaeon]|nr:NAD(P)-dependent oxidoreductase [Thermoplasmata archaeon]